MIQNRICLLPKLKNSARKAYFAKNLQKTCFSDDSKKLEQATNILCCEISYYFFKFSFSFCRINTYCTALVDSALDIWLAIYVIYVKAKDN